MSTPPSSEYSSSNASESYQDSQMSDLDDIPLFLGANSNRGGSASFSGLPGLQFGGASTARSNDGSRTARPALGKLQFSSLEKTTDAQPPVFQQRQRSDHCTSSELDPVMPPSSRNRGTASREEEAQATSSGNTHLSSRDQQAALPSHRPRAASPSLSLGGLRGIPPPGASALPLQEGASTSVPLVNTNNIANGVMGPSESVAVSLLSYAFATIAPPSLPSSSNSSSDAAPTALHESIAQRISSQLGVRPQDLQLFELKAVGSRSNSNSCSGNSGQQQQPQHHVGAMVSNSGERQGFATTCVDPCITSVFVNMSGS